jgi:hypothetical protein
MSGSHSADNAALIRPTCREILVFGGVFAGFAPACGKNATLL